MSLKKIVVGFAILLSGMAAVYGGTTRPSKFTNRGGIANTRHNLTQAPPAGGINSAMMAYSRNDYGEICVYCHTPHGADATTKIPLWNRTTVARTYKTYNELNTSSLTQAVSQPGANSLSCLSCHDGQTAVDSIINMPGSGRYNASQASSVNLDFLTTWTGDPAVEHMGLRRGGESDLGCMSCHSTGPGNMPAAVDFAPALMGTDLTNDHPVGITFPTAVGPGTEWRTPATISKGVLGDTKFFDDDGDGSMDKGEIRMYTTDALQKVECASCHDPHGVPSGGPGSAFFPTFLRKSNTNSGVCLTCHNK